MLTVAIPKRNKLQNIIVLTPKDGFSNNAFFDIYFVMHIILRLSLAFPISVGAY